MKLAENYFVCLLVGSGVLAGGRVEWLGLVVVITLGGPKTGNEAKLSPAEAS